MNDNDLGSTLAKIKAKRELLKYQQEKLEFDKLSGDLVPKGKMLQNLESCFINIRNKLNEIPEKTAPLLKNKKDIDEIKTILAEKINACLKDLSVGKFD